MQMKSLLDILVHGKCATGAGHVLNLRQVSHLLEAHLGTLIRVVIHSASTFPLGSELNGNCWKPPEYLTGKIVTRLLHL